MDWVICKICGRKKIGRKERKGAKKESKMKIAVIDDYQNAFKPLKCFPKLAGHDVVVFTDTDQRCGEFGGRN